MNALWIILGIFFLLMISRRMKCQSQLFLCILSPFKTYLKTPKDGIQDVSPEFISGNSVELLINGNQILPKMLDEISNAALSIRWHVMLFTPDDSGLVLADTLIKAAKRGVKVQLAFDIHQSINSTFFAPYSRRRKALFNDEMNKILAAMQEVGIEVLDSSHRNKFLEKDQGERAIEIHNAISNSTCIKWNHYDHRKILILDDEIAIIGGMNVGNEYLYLIPPELTKDSKSEELERVKENKEEAWEKWQDSAIWVRGPIASEIAHEFNIRWEILGGRPIHPLNNAVSKYGDVDIQLLRQNPVIKEISTTMVRMMDSSKHEIFLAYPYVSHHVLLESVKEAAKRGVNVKFVYPGKYNDVSISRRLLQLFTKDLLEAGVEVYENNLRMNHTKLMIVDRKYLIIGSHNLNYRSVNHDQEMNLLVRDEQLVGKVIQGIFSPYFSQSIRLTQPYNIRWSLLDHLILPFS